MGLPWPLFIFVLFKHKFYRKKLSFCNVKFYNEMFFCTLADIFQSSLMLILTRFAPSNNGKGWALFVAQLAERSLPISVDQGSNTDIGSFYWTYLFLSVCRKDENKIKIGQDWPIFKNNGNANRDEALTTHTFPLWP